MKVWRVQCLFDSLRRNSTQTTIEFEDLAPGQLIAETHALWQKTHQPLCFAAMLRDIETLDGNVPRGRQRQSHYALQGSGLPASVWPKQRERLTPFNLERDLVHSGELLELLRQISDFNGHFAWAVGHSISPSHQRLISEAKPTSILHAFGAQAVQSQTDNGAQRASSMALHQSRTSLAKREMSFPRQPKRGRPDCPNRDAAGDGCLPCTQRRSGFSAAHRRVHLH